MDLLPGFVWPVPRAFAAAVSGCRFEQGDVFYDDARGYAGWRKDGRGPKGAKGAGCWVQVLDPPRTARTAPADAEGNRFAANWVSPVTVERGRPGSAESETLQCTQGRLFSCLWRGAPGLLEEAAVDPPMPRGARDLQKQLDAALPALRKALGRGARLFFACVVDESSEASLAKGRAIAAALGASEPAKVVSLSPGDAGIPDGDAYHPALRVQAALATPDEAAARDALKRALYAPTRPGGGGDRFKLERHGVLAGAAAPEEESS